MRRPHRPYVRLCGKWLCGPAAGDCCSAPAARSRHSREAADVGVQPDRTALADVLGVRRCCSAHGVAVSL